MGTSYYLYSYPWKEFYSAIYPANYVYNAVEVADYEGEEALRAASLRGEAALIRAYCYLMLVILYAENYKAATADATLGVPLVLEAFNASLSDHKRHTVKEVYDQIEQDILFGIEHLNERFVDGKFRFFKTAAYALASRYYLYKASDYINHTEVNVPVSLIRDAGPQAT